MSDIEKARRLFQEAGLPFPASPEEFLPRLRELGEWCFATREMKMSPYALQHYIAETEKSPVEDYVVLANSGHGINSYAIQYYLVYGPLRMFLFLGWGGVYVDKEEAAALIRNCFSLADEIVPAARATARAKPTDRLMILGSDFYGSYWLKPGVPRPRRREAGGHPVGVLTEVLGWVKGGEERV